MAELKAKTGDASASQPNSIQDWVNTSRFKDSLASILPKHLTSERFAAVAMRQFRTTPGLLKCSPESVLSAFMEAASLGLEIGLNGESYIIPWFNNVKQPDNSWAKVHVAQLQIGYLGHLKLAWNSGLVSSVEADVVTHGEVDAGRFSYQRGTDGFLHHRPEADRDLSEGNIAFAYGMVWVKGSDRPVWRVLDKTQIERLRNTGQSANSPAWKNHYDEMAMAKALKRTMKWAPKSREQAAAIAVDDQADAGIAQDFAAAGEVARIIPAELTKKSAAQEMMDKQAEGEVPPETEAAGSANGTVGDVPPPPDREMSPARKRRPDLPQLPDPSDLGW
jgi:recombination protein RecT